MRLLSPPSPNPYIREIDGLRGIAILSILVVHWVVPFIPLTSQTKLAGIPYMFAYGVDLFFVVSGFLIGRILLKTGKQLSSAITFYIRRILRIWPPYYLLLGLVYFLWGGLRVFAEIPYWSYFIFMFNFWESMRVNFNFIFSTLWSLAVEEQFYAVAPVLFFHLKPRQLIYLTIFCLIVSPFLRLLLVLNTNMILWRFTPVRLDGISTGILLSIVFASPGAVSFLYSRMRILRVMTFTSLVLSIVLKITLPDSLWFSFGTSLMDLSFGLLLTTVVTRSMSGQTNSILNSPFLCYFGLRCYTIYLFHIFFMEITKGISSNYWTGLLIEFILTMGFAHLSWRYIESPIMKVGRKISQY